MIEKSLLFVNVLLLMIIIINVMRFSKSKEYFDIKRTQIESEMRPCTIYLTDDEKKCDNFEKLYKMGNIQFNHYMKNSSENNKGILEYIEKIKKNSPLNQCKIQFQQYEEVKKMYGIELPYKNITKNIQIDNDTLSGYCLYENKNGKVYNNKNSKIYDSIQIKNDLDIIKLENTFPLMCQYDDKIKIDDNLTFLKFYCRLSGKDLVIYKMEILSVSNNKFQKESPQYDISNFFTYKYDTINKMVTYEAIQQSVSFYVISFDICKKIEHIQISHKKFSFEDLHILPLMVVQNIDIEGNKKDKDILQILNLKLIDITIERGNIQEQLSLLQDKKQNVLNIYALEKDNCQKLSDTEQYKCMQELKKVSDDYDMIDTEIKILQEKLKENEYNKKKLMQSLQKIKQMKITDDFLNEIIQKGINVDYDKYIDFVSNDDCIYIQFK